MLFSQKVVLILAASLPVSNGQALRETAQHRRLAKTDKKGKAGKHDKKKSAAPSLEPSSQPSSIPSSQPSSTPSDSFRPSSSSQPTSSPTQRVNLQITRQAYTGLGDCGGFNSGIPPCGLDDQRFVIEAADVFRINIIESGDPGTFCLGSGSFGEESYLQRWKKVSQDATTMFEVTETYCGRSGGNPNSPYTGCQDCESEPRQTFRYNFPVPFGRGIECFSFSVANAGEPFSEFYKMKIEPNPPCKNVIPIGNCRICDPPDDREDVGAYWELLEEYVPGFADIPSS